MAAEPLWGESNIEYFFKRPQQHADVVIVDVISADTVVLNTKEVIKLIGLKAPLPPPKKKTRQQRDAHGFVINEPLSPLTPIDEKALRFAQELLNGRHVRIEFDKLGKDKDFKTLAYVFLLDSGKMANTLILKAGYADLQIQPPNTKYADALRAAYREARQEKRGLQNR